jgi:hypothetical protein
MLRSLWMFRSQLSLLTCGAALIFVGPTEAAETKPFTGRELFHWCTEGDAKIGQGLCIMYITGFVHGLRIAGGRDKAPNLTGEEARAVFVRTVRTTGELLLN